MDEPTIFADTAPCWGIRVAQAADIEFRVVNYHTFTSVATYLVNHFWSGISLRNASRASSSSSSSSMI